MGKGNIWWGHTDKKLPKMKVKISYISITRADPGVLKFDD